MSKLTFSIKAENQNATRLNVDARQFKIVVDEPVALGGNDEGANPVEYILAGYAGCLNVVGHIVAKELGIKLKRFAIEISGDINPARFLGQPSEERAGFQSLNVTLKVDSDADELTLSKWLKIVEYRCPVNDNLSNPTPIKVALNQLVSLN